MSAPSDTPAVAPAVLLPAAGRELDALVAEKVMGWEPRGAHPLFGTPVYHHRSGPTGEGDSLLPQFSTDIAAAWTVVEAMESKGWNVTIRRTWDGYVAEFDDLSRAVVVSVDPREGNVALAICRAALLAMEVPRG